MTDERWEIDLLEHLSRGIAYPATPELGGPVLSALAHAQQTGTRSRRWRAYGLAAGALLLAMTVTIVVSRDARDAVASFLGLGVAGERIEVVPAPRPGETATLLPSAQPLARYGERSSRRDAVLLAGFEPRLPASLGEPRGYYVLLAAQQILVADYGDVQVWEFRLESAFIAKLIAVDGGVVVSETEVNGVNGYWISGGSRVVSVEDPAGTTVARTQRTVDANALVWADGGLYRRIEGVRNLEEALRLAGEMP